MLNKKIGLSAGLMTLGIAAANAAGTGLSFADDATAAAEATAAAGTAAPEATQAPATGLFGCLGSVPAWVLIIIYVVILGAMFYFLILRPQRKRKKEEAEMKSSMTLGQEIVTIGGIVGTIVNIKDDNITIQTSLDNSLVEVKSWAIRVVKTEEKAEEKN